MWIRPGSSSLLMPKWRSLLGEAGSSFAYSSMVPQSKRAARSSQYALYYQKMRGLMKATSSTTIYSHNEHSHYCDRVWSEENKNSSLFVFSLLTSSILYCRDNCSLEKVSFFITTAGGSIIWQHGDRDAKVRLGMHLMHIHFIQKSCKSF